MISHMGKHRFHSVIASATCLNTQPFPVFFFCFYMISTSQVLLPNLSHGKDAGRRGYIDAINVCCLDNSYKIIINHQPANEHLQP